MGVTGGSCMTPVLVTGMGSNTAISVAKGLRRQSEFALRIVGTDMNCECEIAGSSFCDKTYTVHGAFEPQYIPELLGICEQERVRILFPIIDREVEVIAAHLNHFNSIGVCVWLSDLRSVQICNDKYETYRFFTQYRIPTPPTWLPKDSTGKETELPYPLIVKPRGGLSSIDVFRVEDAAELEAALKKVKRPIVQEYVEGKEFTIDVLADQNARVLAVVPRERIETKAGLSYKGRTVRDQTLIDQAEKIARALIIKGPCNIQCRMRDGLPKFLEVNPRFSGGLPLTIAAGVNSPLLLVKLALKGKLDRSYFDFEPGVYMARYFEEVFSQEAREGQRGTK